MISEDIGKVSYEEFLNLDFRIGEIIACEEVKRSKKLLCFQVQIGEETLQILSGVKDYYSPSEVIGKRVMVLANLKPITISGKVSEGMILSAEDKSGNLSFVIPERRVDIGAEVC